MIFTIVAILVVSLVCLVILYLRHNEENIFYKPSGYKSPVRNDRKVRSPDIPKDGQILYEKNGI